MKNINCFFLQIFYLLNFWPNLISMHNKENVYRYLNAAKSGAIMTFSELINTVDVNSKNFFGQTALHLACIYDQKKIIDLLLKHNKIDPNSRDNNLWSPLHFASKYGNFDAIESLLDHPKININARNNKNRTPLHLACKFNHKLVVKKLLIHKDINSNIIDNHSWAPLHFVSKFGYPQIAQDLINHKKTNINLKKGDLWSPLHLAIYYDKFDIAKLLLNNNEIDVNAATTSNLTPILLTIVKQNFEILSSLLNNENINLNIKSKNISQQEITIYQKAKLINPKMAELILEKINIFKKELFESIKNNDYKKFKKYLLKVGSIKIRDDNLNTILHQAVISENKEFVLIILQISPELIDTKNKNGYTPIHLATSFAHRNPQILAILIKMAFFLRENQLFYAIFNKNKNKIKEAIDAGALIDVNEYYNNLIANAIIATKDKEIYQIFLDKKIKFNKKDLFGCSNISWLKFFGENELAEFLEKKE